MRILKPFIAGIILLPLAACGSETKSVSSAVDDGPGLPSAVAEEPEPEPEGPPRSDRGHIIKDLGEEGGFSDPVTGEVVATFAVDSVAPVKCTEDYYEYQSAEPENGHLIAVDMRFSTAPEFAETYYTVSSYDFQFIDTAGVTHTDLGTMATYGCLDVSEEFTTSELSPGSQYVGKIVLDVPDTAGTLVYQPSSYMSDGWEWKF